MCVWCDCPQAARQAVAKARLGGDAADTDLRVVHLRRGWRLRRHGRRPLAAGGAQPRVRLRHQPPAQDVQRGAGRVWRSLLRVQAAHLRHQGAAAARGRRPRRLRTGHSVRAAIRVGDGRAARQQLVRAAGKNVTLLNVPDDVVHWVEFLAASFSRPHRSLIRSEINAFGVSIWSGNCCWRGLN